MMHVGQYSFNASQAFPPSYDSKFVTDWASEHCIDYIRQSIMCFGDSTPVRLQWRYESHFLIPQFDQYHTCRNFEALHDFSKKWALELQSKEINEQLKKLKAEGVL